jgi:hypothetical protein
MFTPLGGPSLGLSFMETYISCVAGAILSSAIFYFSANILMKRSEEKYLRKLQESIDKGIPFKRKKKFTRMNKFIVRMKRSFGLVGISFWAPLFLSIPGGSIVSAKFYGKLKITYPLIVLGIILNGGILTGIAYLFFS